MNIYEILYNKGYLKGDKEFSPLSVKGLEKLSEKYKKDYLFIDILNIKEKEFYDEFFRFMRIYDNIKNEKCYKEFENECYKLVDDELNAMEEYKLFLEMKKFNMKNKDIKNVKDKKIMVEIIRIKNFSLKYDEIIKDLICERIFYATKSKDLTFFVWIDLCESHYSLVCNIGQHYIFLDSCSSFYNRYPSKRIISTNTGDGLFIKGNVIYMRSFLQNDEYNCGSYVFGFIEILSEFYKKFNYNKTNLLKHILSYFNTYTEHNLLSESYYYNFSEGTEDFGNIVLGKLPFEFLELSKYIPNLNKVKNSESNEELITKLDDIISKSTDKKNKSAKIDIIRKKHLYYLLTK